MPFFIEPLLYFVSFGAFAALALVTVILAGFLVYRGLKVVGKLVRKFTPD